MQILRIFILEKRVALAVTGRAVNRVSARLLLSPFAALETDRNYSIVLVVSPPNVPDADQMAKL